ncbi:cytochrome P450 CYP12A2-like isoform X2 [Melitaea cinxia]|uniref:cytochrome P450 CYP12A2-like isoform X2 n=1 Tax=Melitaea cinxia TaxID=113334 RepID=UPI001E26F141|nr:cytochrome P450 CYP12A2-like isoform X2 [Melitaea cinxia]
MRSHGRRYLDRHHYLLLDNYTTFCLEILRGENLMPVRPGFNALTYYRKQHNKQEGNPDATTGLITDHGDAWKNFRLTVNPILMQPQTVKLYRNSLTEVAEDMVKRMRKLRNDKNMIDGKFNVEMNLWALEAIGVVALGGRLNCLDLNLPKDSPAKKLISLVHEAFSLTEKLEFQLSMWKYFATPTFKKAMKCYDEQRKLNIYFITKAREELKKKQKSASDAKSVLEKLLDINETVALNMASDMLFAGVDTSANTVTTLLYHLATHPEKQSKLRKELRSKDEKQSYLKACIKESLRLNPVVIGNLRLTTKEYNILGYNIPKQMIIVIGNQVMSMMEQHYPRPKEFIPERWLVDKSDPLCYSNAHPFAYAPFGFGSRACIGQRIATLEIETFIATIIKNFEVEWFGPPPQIRVSTINYFTEPYNFTFKDI